MADGFIDGPNLICGVHNWDYRYDTGISEYNNDEASDAVFVSEKDIADRIGLCKSNGDGSLSYE